MPGMPPDPPERPRFRAASLISGAMVMGGCTADGLTFLAPGGPVARSELSHFTTITAVSLIAIVPVFLLLPVLLWRYRLRGGHGAYRPKWDYSRPLELAMWGVPVAIVCVLGWHLMRNAFELDPYRRIDPGTPPLRIEAVALNWKWLFLYPDHGIATVDRLAIPVGLPVEFRLTSDTVMQSFMVSALAGQIYVMPGMETYQYLLADTAGDYVGRNTQYNGPDFAGQSFVLSAVDETAFGAFIEEARTSGLALDAATYARLALPSDGADAAQALGLGEGQAILFKSIPDEFFTSLVQRYMNGAAMQDWAQPGAPGFRLPQDPIPEVPNAGASAP